MGGSVDTSMLDGMVWDDKTQSLVPDPALSQAPAQAAPQAPAPQPTYDLEGTEITDPNIIASMNGTPSPMPDFHGQAGMAEQARMLESIGQAPTPENGVATPGGDVYAPNARAGTEPAPQTPQIPGWMQGSIPSWSGTQAPPPPQAPPQSRAPMYTPPQWNNTVVPMGPGIPQTGLNGPTGHFGRQASMVDLAAGLRNVAANAPTGD